ncbi:MAG: hypothetical protein AAF468_04580 [Pseudomonadota bacterium]
MVLFARILLFIQIVALFAVAATVLTFLVAIFFGTLSGVSSREGALAMGAAGVAPLGGIVGAALGAWVGWKITSRIGRAAALSGGYGLMGFALLGVIGWFILQDLTDGDPYHHTEEPVMHLEWRLNETVPHAQVDRIFRFMMRSSYENWILSDNWDEPRARDEDGRTILRRKFSIRWRVNGRTLQVWRAPGHGDRITIEPKLPRDPKPTADYGPWHEVEGHPDLAYRIRIGVKEAE